MGLPYDREVSVATTKLGLVGGCIRGGAVGVSSLHAPSPLASAITSNARHCKRVSWPTLLRLRGICMARILECGGNRDGILFGRADGRIRRGSDLLPVGPTQKRENPGEIGSRERPPGRPYGPNAALAARLDRVPERP